MNTEKKPLGRGYKIALVGIVAFFAIMGLIAAAVHKSNPGSGGTSAPPAVAQFCASYVKFINDTAAAAQSFDFSQSDADGRKMHALATAAGDPFKADVWQGTTTGTMGPVAQDCTNAGFPVQLVNR